MSHKTLKAEIVEIKDKAEDIKSFFIRPDEELKFLPGQFFTLSLCGVGEAPFSVASAPHEGLLRFTIRKTGKVTSALHRLKAGDILGIRGPYGNGFPLDPGGTAVIVGGGIGMAPVRSLLFHLQEKGIYDLWAFNGARSPRHILYVDELLGIKGRTKIILTVDRVTPGWKYDEGVITMPMEKYIPKIERGTAYLCGPSVMFKYAV
ncbi:MAG: heterodisulfide reductase subunit F, partial [Candidatus Hydrothermae bacterium]|nr:heterodisulfide reductase subunit F [Candidatus Hydrothermae bacterium]